MSSKKKGRNKKWREEKKQKKTKQKTCISRQAVENVPSKAYLLRANGFRRKLLLTFDVVSLCFDYFTLTKLPRAIATYSTKRDSAGANPYPVLKQKVKNAKSP